MKWRHQMFKVLPWYAVYEVLFIINTVILIMAQHCIDNKPSLMMAQLTDACMCQNWQKLLTISSSTPSLKQILILNSLWLSDIIPEVITWNNVDLSSVRSNNIHLKTLRPRKMADILQTIFSNVFSSMKMFQFWLKFHWSLFLGVQLT